MSKQHNILDWINDNFFTFVIIFSLLGLFNSIIRGCRVVVRSKPTTPIHQPMKETPKEETKDEFNTEKW